MKKLYAAMNLLLIYSFANAQFTDSVNHYLNYTGTGVINKTDNGTYHILNNQLRFSIRKKTLVLNSTSSWIYGKQQDKLLNDDYFSVLDFNLYKTWPHFNYWGLGSLEKSFSLKVKNRFQVGLGGAYNLLEREHALINLSDGIIYEQSNLLVNDGTNRFNQTLRNSVRIKLRFVWNNIFQLDGAHYLQHSLSETHDYIVKSNTNLSIKIWQGLSLTSTYTYNRVNIVKRENYMFSFGVGYEKYF